jgi:hypothetical protein
MSLEPYAEYILEGALIGAHQRRYSRLNDQWLLIALGCKLTPLLMERGIKLAESSQDALLALLIDSVRQTRGVLDQEPFDSLRETALGIALDLIQSLARTPSLSAHVWQRIAQVPGDLLYCIGGWGLTSLSSLWRQGVANFLCHMHQSRDPAVHDALHSRISWERSLTRQRRFVPEIADALGDPEACKRRARLLSDQACKQAPHRPATRASKWWEALPNSDALVSEFTAALYGLSPSISCFVASAMMDACPTLVNKHTWGVHNGDVRCPLCLRAPQTTRHVLSQCRAALEGGRYTHRHNLVLECIASAVRSHFHEQRALVWFDLPSFGHLPSTLALAGHDLRPDGLVELPTGERFLVELTVPWEERLSLAHDAKCSKYDLLLRELQASGPATLLVVEVGARGQLADSCVGLNALLSPAEARECRRRMTQAAITGSYHIWLRRHSSWSSHP